MVIFHSYVSLPEGSWDYTTIHILGIIIIQERGIPLNQPGLNGMTEGVRTLLTWIWDVLGSCLVLVLGASSRFPSHKIEPPARNHGGCRG